MSEKPDFAAPGVCGLAEAPPAAPRVFFFFFFLGLRLSGLSSIGVCAAGGTGAGVASAAAAGAGVERSEDEAGAAADTRDNGVDAASGPAAEVCASAGDAPAPSDGWGVRRFFACGVTLALLTDGAATGVLRLRRGPPTTSAPPHTLHTSCARVPRRRAGRAADASAPPRQRPCRMRSRAAPGTARSCPQARHRLAATDELKGVPVD